MKAFLRWAGSKKQLLPTLGGYWHEGGTYFEPFAGSSCLFFHLEPAVAVLGDINRELMLTLRGVRNRTNEVISLLNEIPSTRREYKRLRRVNPQSLSISERAARFIFLNHHCFNGLYRTNLLGQFNVPLGRHKAKRKIDIELIRKAGRLLRRATLTEADFEETIANAESGDFVYLDPPYLSSKRRIFSEYGPKLFGEEDLERLRKCLSRLHKKKVRFAVSYCYSHHTRELFDRWNVKRIRTRRNIAGFASARRGAYELIACNFSDDGELIP